jgi:sarcosine oxidase subunit gamma
VPETVAISALQALAVPGRFGREGAAPGLVIRERVDLGLATVMVRRGREQALVDAVRAAYGVGLVDASKVSAGPQVAFVGSGPGHWLAVSESLANGALAADLAARLPGLVSIFDQSDGRGVLRLSGPRVRDVLAKGLPIDLHPRAFAPGDAATSIISHIGVQLWQVDGEPTYDIAFFRSFAGSFWHWLAESAAEFGYRVDPPRG